MNADEVYQELKECGCCLRCCLRFMGEKSANYEDPLETLQNLLVLPFDVNQIAKKTRSNPCTACLGILEDRFIETFLEEKCWCDLDQFDSETYRINLTLPPNILIREKAIELHIKNKFPDFYELNSLSENLMLVNIVFKLSFKSKLDKHCGKKYDVHSGLQLWVTLNHDRNEEEVKIVQILNPKMYRERKNSDKIYSKAAVTNILATVDERKFLENAQVPPDIPTNPARVTSVQFETLPIYIGGRYCKYSRTLWQTPWNVESSDAYIDGLSSVQDIIFNAIFELFRIPSDKLTFTASGREDVDVRCLGRGRPFYVKIDSIRRNIKTEKFRELEKKINISPDIAVFDMQQVDKNSIKSVKHGEEMKRKAYHALCINNSTKYTEEIIEALNEIGLSALTINQKTPVRVSHRRALFERTKQIYSMKASEVPGNANLFQLSMITQAGTYVKEFVHGDFGRTKPSVCDLINGEVDIFRLDVIGIDLDWPPHINSIEHPFLEKFSWSKIKKEENTKDVKLKKEENVRIKQEF